MANRNNEFLLRQILEQQNPMVQFRVGMNLLTGKHAPAANPLVGRLLMTMAAKNGHRRAMWILQIGYMNGKWDFPLDEKKGMYWGRSHVADLHRAAKSGDQGAIGTLDVLKKFRDYQGNRTSQSPEIHSEEPPAYKIGKHVYRLSFTKPMQLDGKFVTYQDVEKTINNVIPFKSRNTPENIDDPEE